MFEYIKQPQEKELIGVDFSKRIPSGVTIEAVAEGTTEVVLEETIGDNAGDYGGHIEIGTPFLTGAAGKEKTLAVMVSAGISGFKYRLSFRVTLSDGQKKEDDVLVTIKET
jgi:hypothetical protein